MPTAFGQAIKPFEPTILPLRPASEFNPGEIIPPSARYLSDLSAIEAYLIAMDGAPPRWDSIVAPGGPGVEEALRKLNEKRDRVRKTRRLIKQRLAFIASGRLLSYDETQRGFPVSLIEEPLQTSWGKVTIKTYPHPLFLVAAPPEAALDNLRKRVEAGEVVEIRLIIVGRLRSMTYGMMENQPALRSVTPRIYSDEIHLFFASD